MKRIEWYLRYIQRLSYRSNKRKIPAFLHIPKTGGTFLAQLDSFDRPVLWPLRYLGHSMIYSKTKFNNLPKGYSSRKQISRRRISNEIVFCVVRNPFDWLVSYIAFVGGWEKKWLNTEHYDYDLCKDESRFELALGTILGRDNNKWPNRRFLFHQIFDEEGNLVPNLFFDNSDLNKQLMHFASENSLEYVERDKQKVGSRKGYKEYYSESTVDLVRKVYARELGIFGYTFSGELKEGLIQFGEKCELDLKYNWESDELFLKGELYEGE